MLALQKLEKHRDISWRPYLRKRGKSVPSVPRVGLMDSRVLGSRRGVENVALAYAKLTALLDIINRQLSTTN